MRLARLRVGKEARDGEIGRSRPLVPVAARLFGGRQNLGRAPKNGNYGQTNTDEHPNRCHFRFHTPCFLSRAQLRLDVVTPFCRVLDRVQAGGA